MTLSQMTHSVNFSSITTEYLQAQKAFLPFNIKDREKNIKLPYDLTGRDAYTDKRFMSIECATYSEALSIAKKHHLTGACLVQRKLWPISILILDIDGKQFGGSCFDKDDKLIPEVKAICDLFPSYTRKSTRGKGIHIVLIGPPPPDCNASKNIKINNVEISIYRDWWLAWTDEHLNFSPQEIVDLSDTLKAVYDEYFGTKKQAAQNYYLDIPSLNKSDLEITNSLRDKFQFIYQGNRSYYGNDESRIDLALLQHLFFKCRDMQQALRILFNSPYFKSKDDFHTAKWDRGSYKDKTIKAAQIEPAIIKKIEAIENNIDLCLFDYRSGETDYQVYLAHIQISRECGKLCYNAPVRRLSNLSGIDRMSCSRSNKRLEDKLNLIRFVRQDKKHLTYTYKLIDTTCNTTHY